MLSNLGPGTKRPQVDSKPPAPNSLGVVDLLLTHVDCSSEEPLVQFQGQYLTICELDYDILQREVQNAEKAKAWVNTGEFCLVEDGPSGHWYRGQVRAKQNDLFEVFLLDYGSVLTVKAGCVASATDGLFVLPPKIVCGFFANILPAGEHWNALAANYFPSIIGSEIKGHIQAILPCKVMILESVAINRDLFQLKLGRHVDVATFSVLVEMVTEAQFSQRCGCSRHRLGENPNSREFLPKALSLQGVDNLLSVCGPQLTVGSKERIRITTAINTHTFCCHLESMAKDLNEMSDKLSSFCESKCQDFCDKPVGNLGLLCAVKWKDEKWYRGIVRFLLVNSEVRVLLVDYGFCESVRVESIRQLPPSFLSEPVMALHCTLSCLRHSDKNILKEQLKHFKRGLLGEVLDIQIDHFSSEKNLHCVTLSRVENVDRVEVQKIGNQSKLVRTPDFCTMEKKSCVKYTNEKKGMGYLENVDSLKDIKENSIFRGFVEYVLNPSDFWLRTEERNCSFENMMHKMTEHFRGLQLHEGTLENPVPGILCCAMYEKDMCYYRAIVTGIIENGAEVFFIDFGNSERVPYMLIKKLPPEFAGEPAFAINCSLAHVVPVADVWTTCANNYFKQAVSNSTLLVHVVYKSKDKVVVELFEKEANESVNMLMARARMAEFWKSKAMKCSMTQIGKLAKCQWPNKTSPAKQKCSKEEHLSRSNSSKGIDPRHHQIVTRMKNAGLATNESIENEMARRIPEPQAAADKILIKEQILKVGSELAVVCCQFNSPSDFWCQPQRKLSNLDKLMVKMQRYYQNNADVFQLNETCCVAKRQEDGKWYRGHIIKNQHNEYDVLLVDFGMTIRQKAHNVRPIKPEFLELEMQAFRCSLYPLVENASGHHDFRNTDASNVLKTFIQDSSQNLQCTVHSVVILDGHDLFNVVDLHSPVQSATKLLMEKALAKKTDYSMPLPSVDLSSYMFSMFDTKIGSSETIYVTHVCSPWQLYIQLERNGNLIEDLMEEVAKKSREMQNENSGTGLINLCLAKYMVDGNWYRGLAFPVQSSQHFNVLFVDYGNMSIVEKGNVQPIPRHATKLLFTPMQALKCSLFGVPKGEALTEVNTWLEKVVVDKLLQATFVAKDEDGTLVCELFDGSVHINEKVRELIARYKEKEEPAYKELITQQETSDAGIGQPNVGDTVKKSLQGNAKLGNTAAHHHYQHLFHGGKSLNPQRSKSSKCPVSWQHRTLQRSHHKAHRNVSALLEMRDNLAVKKYKAVCSPWKENGNNFELPKLSLLETKLKPGFRGVGYVSHVNGVRSFYIQMENDEEKILRLGEELNSVLFRENREHITGKVRIGDLVAMEYKEDGALYRAVVTAVSDKFLRVEFIDYGNTAIVEKDGALKLPSRFLTQPRFSIHCSHVRSCDFEDDISFRQSVTGKPLMVEFVKCCGLQWKVNIEIPQEGIVPAQQLSLREREDEGRVLCDSSGKEEQSEAVRATLEDMQTRHSCREVGVTISTTADDNDISENVTRIESKENTLLKNDTVQLEGKQPLMSKQQGATVKSHLIKCSQKLESAKSTSQTHGDAPEISSANIPPYPNIRPGQIEDVTLLSVLENGDFYVRVNQNSKAYTLLGHLLEKEEIKCNLVSVIDAKEGLECLAKSSKNKQWYRAVVQKAHIDQRQCSVFMVDCGVSEVVSIDYIRELCDELRQIPVQAILCRWDVLAKPTGEANESLREQLRGVMEQDVKITFVSYSAVSKCWTVQITVSGIYLKEQNNETKKSVVDGGQVLPKELSMKEENLEDGHQAPRLRLAPVKTAVGYLAVAAAVATPFEFYIILKDLFLTMSIVSAALEELPDDLVSLPDAFLIPGACCLAWSEAKKQWCRSEIVSVDGKSVIVSFADYGHCAITRRNELKKLPEKLAAIPKVTHPCVLGAVGPAGEEHWSDDAVVYFQERMSEDNLMVYFRQYVCDTRWEVDILSRGFSVAKALVNAGHATYIDNLLLLQLQEEPVTAKVSLEGFTLLSADITSLYNPEINIEDKFFPSKSLEYYQPFEDLGTVKQHDVVVGTVREPENQNSVEEKQEQGPAVEDCHHAGTERIEFAGSSQEVFKCDDSLEGLENFQ